MQPLASVSDCPTYLRRSDDYRTLWERQTSHFRYKFKENEYGCECYVYDHLWFLQDLKVATVAIPAYLAKHFSGENSHHLSDEQEQRLCISAENKRRIEIRSTDTAAYFAANTLHAETQTTP